MTYTITDLEILVIEDDAPKLKAIIGFLKEDLLIFNIHVAKSLTSAIQNLSKKKFDFCIIDMSIPTYDFEIDKTGGEPQSGGGRDILRFIKSEASTTKAVVLTQYNEFPTSDGGELTLDSLREALMSKFRGNLLSVIFYSTQQGEWRKLLKSTVEEMCDCQ